MFVSSTGYSQKYKVYGNVKDTENKTLPNAIIKSEDLKYFTTSDPEGYYELILPAGEYVLIATLTGYSADTVHISIHKSEQINFILPKGDVQLDPIEAIAKSVDESGMERLSTRSLSVMPDISGNAVETLIKTGMGVSSSNELSSQYNVRGGNFDENLIYVNGIEVYRPFLVRSGQQEGMSFINSDLVESVRFSAGGFGAEYDDKMSSVLDVTYKRPTDFKASVTTSLLLQQAHIENVSKNGKFHYIAGIRHKESRYLLKTLEVKGDYKPVFSDFQTYITYDVTQRFSVSLLGNIASNVYIFEPTISKTEFGTFTQRFSLNVAYEGQEKDRYSTYFGSLIFNWHPTRNMSLRLSNSNFYTSENEKFDILAEYWLNETAIQSDSLHNAGDSLTNLGVGAYLTHARNYLNAYINETLLHLSATSGSHFLQTGIRYKREEIFDIINEWKYIDSADYSITPEHVTYDTAVAIYKHISGNNHLITNRLNFYIQDTYNFYALRSDIKLKFGVRFSFNDYNRQLLVSPRFSVLFEPENQKNWYYRFSSGVYYQPPFYREIRKFDGTIIANQKAQRSIHFIFGAYHNMKIWGRPFKFSTEIYYKDLDMLIPYELDNLRIRYYADQRSKGFAAGADFKLYGEFVRGLDSWVSLSFLKTMEDIYGDYYYEYLDSNGVRTFNKYEIVDTVIKYPGYLPRPSDRLVNMSIYFQDYVPGHENYKVNLTLFFGTPLPFGPPEQGRYLATYRPGIPYIRSDIGFSFLLKSPLRTYPKGTFLSAFHSIWLQIEAFNFMGIRNIAGYDWIELVPNTANPMPVTYQTVAVPNRLTGRLINFKLIFKFE